MLIFAARVLSYAGKFGSALREGASAARRRLGPRTVHGHRPTILMYHRIAEESFDPWGLAVEPRKFEEQLDWLVHNRTVLSLDEFGERHKRRSLPADAIAITFDDGYACLADIVAPMLEKFGVRPTVFIPVDLIDRRRPFWWDELEDIVLDHEGANLEADGEQIALGPRVPADRQWRPQSPAATERQASFEKILTQITRKRPAERDRIMDQLRHQCVAVKEAPSSKRPMTPEELRAIAPAIVDIGSHTRAHPWLTDLGASEQREQISGSVDRITKMTGCRPTSFAYPYGSSDAQSRRLVAEANFTLACVTGNRRVSNLDQPLALPRVRVGNWSAAELEHALTSVRAA